MDLSFDAQGVSLLRAPHLFGTCTARRSVDQHTHGGHGHGHEAMREIPGEGIDDARYMTTLENMIARASTSASLLDEIAAAGKVLKGVLDNVDVRIYNSLRKFTSSDIQDLRMDLIGARLALDSAMKNKPRADLP